MEDAGLTFTLGSTTTTLSNIKKVRLPAIIITASCAVVIARSHLNTVMRAIQPGCTRVMRLKHAIGRLCQCLLRVFVCAVHSELSHSHIVCIFVFQAVVDAGLSRAATTMDANSDIPTLKNAFDSSVVTVS